MTLLAKIGQELPQRYYVGIDIGYREHVAAGISLQTFARGSDNWKRTRTLSFPTIQVGFERFQSYLDNFSTDPQEFLILCEPTGGYYGAALYQYLLDHHYPTFLINNATTRHMREKIFGNIPKTDEIEARVMARIAYLHEAVGEEFSLRPLQLPSLDDAELLTLCRNSWKVNTMVTRARNQFSQLMAVIFPELKFFYPSSVSTLAPVTLIAHYPSPDEIAAASQEEVYQVLWRARSYSHAKRVNELQTLARHSVGLLPDPGRAWRLKWLTDYLLTNFQLLSQLEKRIEQATQNQAGYSLLVGVPYSGPTTLGIILAATGQISRFPNYRRYVAYTGYFAGLEKSQTIDRTRMSTRGNRDLKRAYFQIVAPMVWFDRGDNPYKKLYERKMAEGRPWYKAMPFVCAALARHIYHCLKFQEPYDVTKSFEGSISLPASDQALVDFQANLEGKFEVMDAQFL